MKTNVIFNRGVLAALALAAVGCGDPEVTECQSGIFDGSNCVITECAEGQVPEGDHCVTPVDVSAPQTSAIPGTGTYAAEVTVTLSSNEPATIYYTTNGSDPTTASTSGESPVQVTVSQTGDLKFFGVDASGNTESVVSVGYTIDDSPPSQVSNFSGTLNGADVALSWTNPSDADLQEVLVVRSVATAVAGFTPAAESTYDVGDVVAPNVVVAYRGTAQNSTDTGARAGENHYAAYTRDSSGNYSLPATTSVDAPFDNGQQATIEVHLAAQQVIVTKQPKDVRLAPAGTFQVGSTDAEVDMGVTSTSGKVLTNLKLVVSAIDGADADGNAVVESDPALHFGLAVPIGGDAISKLKLANVGGTDPITITFEVYSDPVLVGPGNSGNSGGYKMVDPRSGTIIEMPCEVYGPSPNNPQRCSYAGITRAPNSSTFYAGFRQAPHVIAFDPVGDTRVVSAPLSANVHSAVTSVAVTPDGNTVLALLNDGQHWNPNSNPFAWSWTGNSVQVVRLNASDLSEIDRVTLISDGVDPIVGRGLAVDGGGTFAAAAVFGPNDRRIYRINLAAFNVNNQVTVGGTARINSVAISNDGSDIYIGMNSGTGADVMGKWSPPAAITNIDLPTAGNSPRMGRMKFGPDGRLYLNMRQGTPSGVYAFDTNTQTFSQITGQAARASALSPDGTSLFTIDDQFPPTVRIIDVETTSIISATQLDTEFSLGRGHFCGEWIEP